MFEFKAGRLDLDHPLRERRERNLFESLGSVDRLWPRAHLLITRRIDDPCQRPEQSIHEHLGGLRTSLKCLDLLTQLVVELRIEPHRQRILRVMKLRDKT